MVGANQLANVHWSAVFDGVELSAADIARLAKEARPLIRSGERWVAIDRADLAAAGFSGCRIETVTLSGPVASAHAPAIGFCQGSPMRGEIEAAPSFGSGGADDEIVGAGVVGDELRRAGPFEHMVARIGNLDGEMERGHRLQHLVQAIVLSPGS